MLLSQLIFVFSFNCASGLIDSDWWIPGYHNAHNGRDNTDSFLNEWTVEVEGGDEIAELVALELGYEYGGQVLGLPNLYTFRIYEGSKQRRAPSEHPFALKKDNRVKWSEQLFTKYRVKRYPFADPDKKLERVKRKEESIRSLETPGDIQLIRQPKLFNDELWSYEWYLQDTRTSPNLPRLDLNVLPVYAMGFNGEGIRVSILDDGIEHNHTDLHMSYDSEISWDCNDGDNDPYPKRDPKNRNSHGTRCAGEIVMTANNKKCGVGVAWGARVGGIRMLDGRITDRIEGEALGYAWDKVDIYSASWGPNDDGKTVEGPGRLAIEALKRGVEKGRGGKGSIYVWANGNGGSHYDNCNCDGYSSSIYTISIGSTSQHGLFPWYGEICSSTLATAYSSGAYNDQKIATTDLNNSCTLEHTGTSAAAPLAAGIIALALQANPNLTWRDVQHLIVWTSEYAPLSSNAGWHINGVGLRFNVRFGFGLLNAGALVKVALNWTTVPEKHTCVIKVPTSNESIYFTSLDAKEISMEVKDCMVNFIEHVELIVNIRYKRRGALDVQLRSPQGTSVQLLSARPNDSSSAGFVNWPLTSVATWGENPSGVWTAVIQDMTNEPNFGEIFSFSLIIHGTAIMPEHMKAGPKKYNYDYNKHFINYYLDDNNEIDNNDKRDMPVNILDEYPRNHHTKEFDDYNEIDNSDKRNMPVNILDEYLRNHHIKEFDDYNEIDNSDKRNTPVNILDEYLRNHHTTKFDY